MKSLITLALGCSVLSMGCIKRTVNESSVKQVKVTSSDYGSFGICAPKKVEKELTLWATNYNFPTFTELASGGVEVLDPSNKTLSRLSQADWCTSALEGSMTIKKLDGSERAYNFADKKGSQNVSCNWTSNPLNTRFVASKYPWGLGNKGNPIIPFRSVATDQTVIPYGTVLFIESAVGEEFTMPDGSKIKHDGYFIAGDVGGGIKDNHIDVYIGPAKIAPFTFVKHKASGTFTAKVVGDEDIVQAFQELNSAKGIQDDKAVLKVPACK